MSSVARNGRQNNGNGSINWQAIDDAHAVAASERERLALLHKGPPEGYGYEQFEAAQAQRDQARRRAQHRAEARAAGLEPWPRPEPVALNVVCEKKAEVVLPVEPVAARMSPISGGPCDVPPAEPTTAPREPSDFEKLRRRAYEQQARNVRCLAQLAQLRPGLLLDGLPEGYRLYLDGLPLETCLRQLHAWQDVAQKRVTHGLDGGDLAALVGQDLPPVDPDPEEAEASGPYAHYRTSLEIAIALIDRRLAGIAAALDIWKAHCQAHKGSEENLHTEDLIALLMQDNRFSRSRAIRTLAAGVGITWAKRTHCHKPGVFYHLMSYGQIAVNLDLDRTLLVTGQWARLPAVAYTSGGGAYRHHVMCLWMDAHHDTSRATQARYFRLSKRQIRRIQRRVGLRQRYCFAQAEAPANDLAEADLAEQLTDRERGTGQKFTWSGANESRRWQLTNVYYGAPGRVLGSKRTKWIRKHAEQLRCRVTPRETAPVATAAPLTVLDVSKRFDTADRAHQWQKKHPDEGVFVLRQEPSRALRYRYAYARSTGVIS